MPIAKVNGINIDYQVSGSGFPLVMIMGMGFGQKGWVFQTRFFKKHYQVITFDNRGAGGSDKPEGPYTIRMMADDTIGLLDHLHIEKAHILGISLGGMIAQEIALNYPQRVKDLVLGCTFCTQNSTSGDYPEWRKAVECRFKGDLNPMFERLFNKGLNRLLFGYVLKKAIREAGEAGNRGAEAQFQASLKHNTADRLPRIKSPTLVIGGTADRVMMPGSFKAIASRIPQSRLVLIENGSHSLFAESAGTFNREVLSFLKA